MIEIKKKEFKNGVVYLMETDDGYPVEVTDTFLPIETKYAVYRKDNRSDKYGNRSNRWMIGVSVMSGCPVRCKFCATGNIKKHRNLTTEEIIEQVMFIVSKNRDYNPKKSHEFKINYTRMGEPFLNISNVRNAIDRISSLYPETHHYVSTIGINDADYSWIDEKITLQLSVHALNDKKRNWLIPYNNKVNLSSLGEIVTKSNLKTTINLTLVDEEDFDLEVLKEFFPKENFFIKISPVNQNPFSSNNGIEGGFINQVNME